MGGVRRAKATLPNGRVVELYSIGELAFRLGRAARVVRAWEVGGVIPPTCFHDKRGARMYTQEQMDIVVKYAFECKLKRGKSIAATRFPEKVAKDWYKLIDKYFSEYTDDEEEGE